MKKPLADVKDLKLTRRSIVAKVVVVLLLASILTGASKIKSTRAQPVTSRLYNLIITSSDLEFAASSLAQWKNSSGIPSRVLNVEWINSTYSGVDEPEKIRNCIIDYYDNFNTKYVTIFGDSDKVPTRYAYLPVPGDDDNYTATDLYYSDLNGTWDSNGDGLYADQRNDYVEAVPEVCVGRIPVSFVQNAQPIVDKIIGYHQQFDTSQNWTRRVVLAAGTGNNGVENVLGNASTVLNEYVANVVKDKEVVKLYESAGNLSTDSMRSEINKGALFVNFVGHGGSDTTPVLDTGWLFYWVVPPIWWNGFGSVDVQSTTNGARLPVVTTCSCLTAKFDDSLADCFGEWFVGHPTGGAIAYFGSTRTAYSWPNNSAPFGLMGEIDRGIYENFYEGFTKLGQMWARTISNYAHKYVQNYQNSWVYDAKTIMEFELLGDPTLRIYNGPETLKVPDEYATIQGAINDAYDGDTVFVRNGTYYEHLTLNRTIQLIGESKLATIIDGEYKESPVLVTADNVKITGFTIQHCNVGGNAISLTNHVNMTFSDNIITGCSEGVRILYSSGDNVSYNDIQNCYYNTGLGFNWAYNNTVYGNIIENCNYGIGGNFWNNTFSENIIRKNGCGISDDFYDCVFFHNSIIDNGHQVLNSNPNPNIWDNGYPSGGNYWSDYSGTDFFSGPYQNETGSDGIGDATYTIDANNLDNYPLMNPWSPPDIAVANLTSAKTVIGQGYTGSINVTFDNLGNKIEAFNATVYANSTCIHSEQTMLAMTNCTLSFRWNTTGFAYGNYTISACAEPVSGETNIANNNFTGGWIVVAGVGDLTGGTPNAWDFVPDGKVLIVDISVVAKCFGQMVPPAPANCDVSGATVGVPDGKILIDDVALVAKHFGEHYP